MSQNLQADCWYKIPVHGWMSLHKPVPVPDGNYFIAEWTVEGINKTAYWTDEIYFNDRIKDWCSLCTFNIFLSAKFLCIEDLITSWRQRKRNVILEPEFKCYKWKNSRLVT